MRRRVYELLEGAPAAGRAGRLFQVFILWLIGLNVIALSLETVGSIHEKAAGLFSTFETFSVVVFSVEYVLRLWSCTEAPGRDSSIAGRLRFVVSPLAIVDVLAVLPFYLPALGVDLRFARMFRFLRILRVAKLGRYSTAIRTLARVLSAKKEELAASLFVLLMLLVAASSLMYFVEHDAQPEKFSSIPETMWWAVATLTTVGYGDMFPITGLGKTLASVIAILGIGLFALPTGILGAGSVEELQNRGRQAKTCPHCGREIPLAREAMSA